jgi:hypothetical protein
MTLEKLLQQGLREMRLDLAVPAQKKLLNFLKLLGELEPCLQSRRYATRSKWCHGICSTA